MLCNYRISKIITSSKKGLQINHPYGVKYISIFHLIFVWVQAIYTMFLYASSSFPVSPQLWQVVFPRSMQVALLVRTRISLNELNRVGVQMINVICTHSQEGVQWLCRNQKLINVYTMPLKKNIAL